MIPINYSIVSDIKSKCLGTKVLTRAATARAPLWPGGKRSDEGGKRMLRTTAQARWLRIIVGLGFFFNDVFLQGELGPLNI